MLTESARRRLGKALLAAVFALAASWSDAATFTVTVTTDSAAGNPVPANSLRKAILDSNANGSSGTDIINFNIPGPGPHVIILLQSLPTIQTPVTINGYSQGGALPNSNPFPFGINTVLKIVLKGGPGIGGLVVSHLGTPNPGPTTIKGLVIQGFGSDGISMTTGGNFVEGNFIGTNVAGDAAVGNVDNGVAVVSSGNSVGGLSPDKRNLISGNGFGAIGAGVNILGSGTSNTVYGNYIGTDKNGLLAIPNAENGVTISPGSQNSIGALLNAAGNLISGNEGYGIFLNSSNQNVIAGNFIGVSAAPALALPNTADGIRLLDSQNNAVGGPIPVGTNVVSGNGGNGILITGAIGTGNLIQGNLVGTDATQNIAIPNVMDGVVVAAGNTTVGGPVPLLGNVIAGNTLNGLTITGNASNVVVQGNLIGMANVPMGNRLGIFFTGDTHDNIVGGDISPGSGCLAPCNIIAFNTQDGVVNLDGGIGNRILSNSIHTNGSAPDHLGIDLWLNGVTANDPGDPDGNEGSSEGNNAQNFPTITMALVSGSTGQVRVRGLQDSYPTTGLNRIQFFATDFESPAPEGRKFVREMMNVPNGPFDTGAFNPPSSVGSGEVVTATATTTDGTSEFSAQIPIVTNQAPVANAGPNQTVGQGALVTLDGTASADPDGLPSGSSITNGNFTWNQTAGPAAVLANPTSANPSFTATVAAAYVFALVVSDGMDLSTNPSSVTVNVLPPGITVTPTAGLVTTEAGGTATFTVRLDTVPAGDVTIALDSSDPTEGTVAPASLTFTPATATTPQTVTATGVDDLVDDGSILYTLVTAPATSADPAYNGFNAADVSATNQDDDTAGVTVTPTSGLITTEAGGTATFTVRLDTVPTGDVIIALSSSDTTEGIVSPSSLTFTPANATTPQTVTATGVDDAIVDGNVAYTLVTAPAASPDPVYDGLNSADVAAANQDNDTAGITVTPTSGLITTEAGGTATFTVALNTAPLANVTIALSSSDTTEGTVSPSSLTFTPGDGTTPQTVTVTGVDDAIVDGSVPYTLVTAPSTSADPAYNGFNAADVSATNQDNDTAGITVTPTGGLVTTEGGGTATFTVVLNTAPLANVTIALSSSDPTEGMVSPSSLTFTPGNGTTPQTVTVTGVDDAVMDGNIGYQAVTAPAASGDPIYNGFDADDVAVINQDDETGNPGFASTPSAPGPVPFGAHLVGTAGNGTILVRETGTALLTLTNPLLGGVSPGDFALGTSFPVSLADGDPAVVVQITCTPSAPGPRTATLTVSTNDAANPSVAYTLNCVGLAPGTTPLGDLDRDSRTDLLWRHEVNGGIVAWFMNGVSLLSGAATSPATFPDLDWKLGGLGDFNTDGRTDFVWHHQTRGLVYLWYMNGLTRIGAGYAVPAQLADTSWRVVSAADFDQDGDPDLLWRHFTAGQIVVWYMDGPALVSGTFTSPSALPDTAWTIVGTGDFNSDGRPDILWYHQGAGQVVVWHMNGVTLAGGTFTEPPSLSDLAWRLVATGDFDADGKPDLVWRHSGSGQIVVWFMDGVRLVSGAFTTPPAVSDLNWRIVGPR